MSEEKKDLKNKNKLKFNLNKNFNSKKKKNFYWIYGIILFLIIALQLVNYSGGVKETNLGELKIMLADNDVEKIVVVNKEKAEIFIKKESITKEKYKDVKDNGTSFNKSPNYILVIGSIESFESAVIEAQKNVSSPVYITYVNRKNWAGDIMSWIFPFLILIVIWVVFMRMMSKGAGGAGGQIFNIGKSKAQLFDKATSVKVDFNNVAGLEEAKIEVMEIVDFLKNPEKYRRLGGKIPKGALLIGPPGTGKTLLAKAVAGEAKVPFFSISGSDFVEMFVGVGASRVRDLFKQAKEKSPCIIFIDEIDAIGRARGKNQITGANDERENTLNQLLTEMDGFASNAGVIILAATNRADILDRALLRAGRFDRQIHVELPDIIERKEIFQVHMKPLKFDESVDVDFLAKQTPGFSGADIANVCNESALIAARKGKELIDKQDFLDAIDRIVAGLEKKSKIITKSEKKVIAFHEAGHASVSWLLRYANPLIKVTIIPRGKSLGSAWYLPEERQITTTEQMFDELCATMGGRASEEVNFGKISTGALNDLEKATKQAFSMVTYYGLNKKIGNISYYDSTGQQEYNFNKPYSEKTAEIIDQEVSKLVEKAYTKAKQLILENKEKVEKLANVLLEKEVIFRENLEEIFGKRPFDDEKAEEVRLLVKEREKQKAENKAKLKILKDLELKAEQEKLENEKLEKEKLEQENKSPEKKSGKGIKRSKNEG
ncbi:MAG: ATP-dependent zinc metalloprotease FtsH [Bacteroidales bacterium]|nr:ATP-dependent zinc metalloprotease FtsH [Bacteroidales bacterium]